MITGFVIKVGDDIVVWYTVNQQAKVVYLRAFYSRWSHR